MEVGRPVPGTLCPPVPRATSQPHEPRRVTARSQRSGPETTAPPVPDTRADPELPRDPCERGPRTPGARAPPAGLLAQRGCVHSALHSHVPSEDLRVACPYRFQPRGNSSPAGASVFVPLRWTHEYGGPTATSPVLATAMTATVTSSAEETERSPWLRFLPRSPPAGWPSTLRARPPDRHGDSTAPGRHALPRQMSRPRPESLVPGTALRSWARATRGQKPTLSARPLSAARRGLAPTAALLSLRFVVVVVF